MTTDLQPGKAFPLGAAVTAGGVNFSVYSRSATTVELLFFDNADFYEFRDHVAGKLRVRAPLVPGVVSILSAAQITKFTQLCGAKIPPPLRAKLDALAGDDDAAADFGIEYATRQCQDLLRAGVPGLHFYTLNKSHSTLRILKNLGLA